MAKNKNTKRKLVGLVSEGSGVRAYYTKKNTMNTPDKLTLRKYDPVLRKHVVFVETKRTLVAMKSKKRSAKPRMCREEDPETYVCEVFLYSYINNIPSQRIIQSQVS